MLRTLLFIFLTFSLAACSDHNNEDVHKTSEKHESLKSHSEHEDHKDIEHHDDIQKKSHTDHTDHKDEEHHSASEDKHDEEGVVHLTPEQMKAANIIVRSLEFKNVEMSIRAPGEIQLNGYKTFKVSPRINVQVTSRHAKLGDEVKIGEALVTLSSVEMAEAQGQLLLADKEWKRVKKLGRKVVSAKRYIKAKVEYEKAFANVKAYGMSDKGISSLLDQKRTADGSFQLVARQTGRILHDQFVIGEYINAGYELMVIADESTMWVEARVTPDVVSQINSGNNAEVIFGKHRISAKVTQLHHSLDEATRTTAVRIEVPNKKDLLHAGMFVTVQISTSNKAKAMQIAEAAVLRSSDGDWVVMVEQEETGEFRAVEVELIQVNDGMAIIEGIKAGTRVVSQGAFFVQSELAKGGFDIHNH